MEALSGKNVLSCIGLTCNHLNSNLTRTSFPAVGGHASKVSLNFPIVDGGDWTVGTAPEASTLEKRALCSNHRVVQSEEMDKTLLLTSNQLLTFSGNIGYTLLWELTNAPSIMWEVRGVNLIFEMARNLSAPSTKTACTWGRGAVSQAEMGGWPTGAQRGTEGAVAREQ